MVDHQPVGLCRRTPAVQQKHRRTVSLIDIVNAASVYADIHPLPRRLSPKPLTPVYGNFAYSMRKQEHESAERPVLRACLSLVFHNFDAVDDHILDRFAVSIHLYGRDRIHHIHAVKHLAENSVSLTIGAPCAIEVEVSALP